MAPERAFPMRSIAAAAMRSDQNAGWPANRAMRMSLNE
jgi:hypothetical protein